MKIFITLIILTQFINASQVRIAVASNVSYVIKPLIKAFNKEHKIKVSFVIGSSGKLTAQIRNRAPFDILLSANMKYPNALYTDKLAKKEPKIYAKGSLSLFSYKDRELTTISIINEVKRIAVANPKTAPYGKATFEALEKTNLLEKNIKKFVYAENISQAVQYSMTATDLGFIATSSLYSPKMKRFKKDINYLEISPKLYNPINQGAVLVSDNKSAIVFYEFLFSKKAKEIFKKYGYSVE